MATFSELLPAWTRHLQAEQRAENSIRSYVQAVRFFDRYTGLQAIRDASRHTVEGWMTERGKTVTGTTLNCEFRAIRLFYRWAVREEEADSNPFLMCRLPKPTTILPDVYTDEDFTRLMKACEQPNKFLYRRDQAMVALLWETGLRRSEIVTLQLHDIDQDTGTIKLISAKNRLRRKVAYSKKTAVLIDRYLRQRKDQRYSYLPYLFIGVRGQLGGHGLYRVMRRLEKRAGFTKTIRPHIFRHSWTNNMLRSGMQPLDVAALAGWKNPAMLQVYGASQLNDRAVEAQHKVFERVGNGRA